ncbi:MAG: hypothetical protein NTW31_02745 [Bacteroidetes bacterium]|nr:hypothetical protein [Bacteroidota bacterium]
MKTKPVLPIALMVLIFLSTINFFTYAQKKQSNKCKYIQDKVDDFTKKRTVETYGETLYDIKKGGFGMSVSDVLDASNRVFLNVYGSNIDGINGLEFRWASIKYGYVGPFNQVELILENGKIISLKEEEESESYKDESFYYHFKIFKINDDSVWNTLKTTPVTKLRLSINGKEQRTDDIDKKNETSIMKVINCIDLLGIPKSVPIAAAPVKTGSNTTQIQKEQVGLFAAIKPLGNNNTISIYKQWKSMATLDKEGIPKSEKVNEIIHFSADGTFTMTILLQDGSTTVYKGTFQLLSDNKIIVYTLENGESWSATIKKLSNKELEIQNSIATIIYTVY